MQRRIQNAETLKDGLQEEVNLSQHAKLLEQARNELLEEAIKLEKERDKERDAARQRTAALNAEIEAEDIRQLEAEIAQGNRSPQHDTGLREIE